ncbi:MAG: hypothetical protein ACRDD1_04995 [Planctomycetia bacterium]
MGTTYSPGRADDSTLGASDWADDAGFYEQTAGVLCVAAVAAPLLMGGGVSAAARCVFGFAAAAALLAQLAAGFAVGRWRLPATLLWLPPLGFVALGFVQAVGVGPAASVHPYATARWAGWAVGLFFVAVVASERLAAGPRHRAAVVALALLVAASGLAGGLQQLAGAKQLFGIVSVQNRQLPVLARDVFTSTTAVGAAAYTPWAASTSAPAAEESFSDPSKPVDETTWFHRRAADNPLFAAFLHPAHWSACAVVLAPLLFAGVLRLSAMAAASQWGEWSSTSEGQAAAGAWLLTLLLAVGAPGLGEPIPALAAIAVGTLVVGATAGSLASAVKWGGPVLLAAAGGAAARLSAFGGMEALDAWRRQAMLDAADILTMLWQAPVAGFGLGAAADVLPHYRQAPADAPLAAGSLLALAVESGWVGVGLGACAAGYLLLRWPLAVGRLDGDPRSAAAGGLGATAAFTVVGLLGVGLDAPAVYGVAVLAFATLASAFAVSPVRRSAASGASA